jgi:hypothetical protein
MTRDGAVPVCIAAAGGSPVIPCMVSGGRSIEVQNVIEVRFK